MTPRVDSIQFALFLRKPTSSDAFGLWMSAFNERPPGYQTLAPNHTNAQGLLPGNDKATITIICQPQRVDLVVQGVEIDTDQPAPPELLEYEVAAARLLEACTKTFPMLDVGRVAAVIQGHIPTENASAAVKKIQELIPGLPIPPGAIELSYQTSTNAASVIEPKRIIKNVFRWQVMQMQMFEMPIGAPVMPRVARQAFAAHIYIDIFSTRMEILSANDAQASLAEICSMAMHAFKHGHTEIFKGKD